jgi:hypothetical protein
VELKESHLLPKALFKLVCDRVGGLGSGHVIVTKEKSFYSDTQIKDYFLCGACESKFSINGESYVISQCHRGRGQFELRELLLSTTPVRDEEGHKVYEVSSLLGDKVEQYLYFAASVFWRASARSWNLGGRPPRIHINLDPYEVRRSCVSIWLGSGVSPLMDDW